MNFSSRVALWCYERAVRRLLPRWLVFAWGDELVPTFEARLDEIRERGGHGLVVFSLREIGNVIVVAVRSRIQPRRFETDPEMSAPPRREDFQLRIRPTYELRPFSLWRGLFENLPAAPAELLAVVGFCVGVAGAQLYGMTPGGRWIADYLIPLVGRSTPYAALAVVLFEAVASRRRLGVAVGAVVLVVGAVATALSGGGAFVPLHDASWYVHPLRVVWQPLVPLLLAALLTTPRIRRFVSAPASTRDAAFARASTWSGVRPVSVRRDGLGHSAYRTRRG